MTAMVVAFGLCELGLRLVAPAPPLPGREPQIVFQSDPNVGFLQAPNQVGWLDDGMATINSLGLRGDLPMIPKPSGAVRVLAIGDSTTFGWGVGDSETYCVELQRMLRREFAGRQIEVVNGGVSAYDLKHDARFLQHFAPILKPDVVLVGLYWNDLPFEQITPDGVPVQAADETTAAAADGGPPSRTFRLASAPTGLSRVLRSSRVLFTLRHAWLNAIAPSSAATNTVQWEMAVLQGHQSPAMEKAWDDIKGTLTQIRDTARTGGFAVGVVIMPIRAQVEDTYPKAQYQSRVQEMAEALGMFVVDPLPRFIEQPDHPSLFIPYDRIHFSPSGNGEVAEAAFEALRTRPEFQTHAP
jgi:lysophospholipase L1-like esterase